MLDHSRHRGESATKTVKSFAAHTVNCVICKNLTRIEWMLLNFTPVIQQNCHQPGRNFQKSFCAVDRLSCQNPKPANSEAILFLIVHYVHVIFLHMGAKCCFEIFKCYTQTDSLLFKKKVQCLSMEAYATIHIACQPFSCKIIFIDWNILSLN